jgi:hypothetical protein
MDNSKTYKNLSIRQEKVLPCDCANLNLAKNRSIFMQSYFF